MTSGPGRFPSLNLLTPSSEKAGDKRDAKSKVD